MVTHEEIAVRILALAAEAPNKTISGGRLSELLKHSFPDYKLADYGTKNLRAFIRDYLPGKLKEVGKVGTDIVYGLPEAVIPQAPILKQASGSTRNITQEVLRVFRSPNAPFELHANSETGVIRVVERGGSIQEPWVRIKPASAETLHQIAKNFAAQLPEECCEPAMRLLDANPHAWWPRFSIYLQETNLFKPWMVFKGEQLRTILETELRTLGVAQSSVSATVPDAESGPKMSLRRADSDESLSFPTDLRSAIIRVVQNLPLSELRGLKLPVGDLFDALTHRN